VEGSEEGKSGGRQQDLGSLTTILTVAGGLLGLGAYVYLLGGFVLWLKFTAARLPTDDAVSPLGGNRLLAVGLKAFVFELVLVAVLLGLAFLAWEAARIRDVKAAKKNEEGAEAIAKAAQLDTAEKWETWRRLLQALIVGILVGSIVAELLHVPKLALGWPWPSLVAGVAAAAIWLLWILPKLLCWAGRETPRRRGLKTWLTVAAAAPAVTLLAAPAGVGVLVLLLFLHLSHHLKELGKVDRSMKLMPSVLIIAGALSLVVATYLATPPVSLDTALVVFQGKDHHTVRGGYIGRSGDGVFLATCLPDETDPTETETTHLRVLAPEKIRRIVLGGSSEFAIDDGRDPSLLDLGRFLTSSQEKPGEWFDTVSLDVRQSELTCGFPRFLTIARRERDRVTRGVSQAGTVPDDGILTLSGPDLRPQHIEADGAGHFVLPLALTPAARAAHLCEGPFRTHVRVRFTHGSSPERRRAVVTMTSATGANRVDQARNCHRAWIHQGKEVPPRSPQNREISTRYMEQRRRNH
jgi:hypothetical protein